jgi:hypothetical protein
MATHHAATPPAHAVLPGCTDVRPSSAQPLPNQQLSQALRSAEVRDDMRDEMSMLHSVASREVPPTERRSGNLGAVRKQTEAASEEADNPSSGMVEGRARGGSLAEEPSTCWLPVCLSSSAPSASEEPGAARAGGARRITICSRKSALHMLASRLTRTRTRTCA